MVIVRADRGRVVMAQPSSRCPLGRWHPKGAAGPDRPSRSAARHEHRTDHLLTNTRASRAVPSGGPRRVFQHVIPPSPTPKRSTAPAAHAISRHFERDPIPYALETDWPVGAAGFEPLHLDWNSPKTLSQGGGIRTSASWNRDFSSGPGPELAYLELQVRRLHSQKTSQASDRRRSPLSHDEVH